MRHPSNTVRVKVDLDMGPLAAQLREIAAALNEAADRIEAAWPSDPEDDE